MQVKNEPIQLNDELRFLIACCQTTPSEEDKEFIQNHIDIINYQRLIRLAYQHGILPLVYYALRSCLSTQHSMLLELNSDTPVMKMKEGCNAFLSKLKTRYMIIAQQNMLMSAELIKIMKLLEVNSIEALAFKGPALSLMAYGDITLRQYLDLDVLVKKEDIYKIDTLLKDHGYQRVYELTSEQEKIWMKFKHDLGLYHPQKGIHFEMHWSLLDEDYPIQMDQDNLWKNPQIAKINQHEIKTFSTEELLLYLCIHGSTHLWERIEWIKDIDLLIRTQEIDWESVIVKAESSNVETIFYLGIYLAHIFFETELPGTISERIYHDNKLANLTDYIVKSWQGNNASGINGIFQRTLAMLRLFPDTKAQLSYLHKIMLKPTLNEYSVIDLPERFYWFYYFVRPYLLVKKYISKA